MTGRDDRAARDPRRRRSPPRAFDYRLDGRPARVRPDRVRGRARRAAAGGCRTAPVDAADPLHRGARHRRRRRRGRHPAQPVGRRACCASTPTLLTGDALRLRSDKLNGGDQSALDLRTGRYEVGLNGGLGRYLIPGLGIVDVQLRAAASCPARAASGTRVVGRGHARRCVRLDNAFFRSLAGGLPRIDTRLERDAGRRAALHQPGADRAAIRADRQRLSPRATAPSISRAAGTQATYGPLTLRARRPDRPADARPRLRQPERGARPVATCARISIRRRRASPSRRSGGSRLGPFTGNGAILLPPGRQATIAIAALDVAGTRARAAARDRRWRLRRAARGRGRRHRRASCCSARSATVQRIEAHLDAQRRAARRRATLRRGQLDAVDAARSRRHRDRGDRDRRRACVAARLSLARFAGTAQLRGGVGEVARLDRRLARPRLRHPDRDAGRRPTAIAIAAQGTLDRRPLQLLDARRS